MTRVLVTSRSFGKGTKDLLGAAAAHGLELEFGSSHHPLAELQEALASAEAWIAGTGPVTAAHMDAAPLLRVIARYGVGVDAVDLAAAADRGITVTNTPGANTGAVADLAVALMLGSLRHLALGDREVRAGRWNVLSGRELGSLTVGIVGFGRIGQGVAQRISGFGSRILAVDPYVPSEVFEGLGVEVADMNSLFAESDVITLHVPGGEVVVDARRLGLMKPEGVLVNTARAELIDEVALETALRDGRIGAFASDVLSGDTEGSASPLLAPELASRVSFTPHVGAQTAQAVDQMGQMALDNVVSVLAGTIPPNPVAHTS